MFFKRMVVHRLYGRIIAGDVAWLFHQVKLRLGLMGPVPRPKVFPLRDKAFDIPPVLCTAACKPVKLLVFSHNLHYEGASISLQELVIGLKNLGFTPLEVVAFEDGPLRAEYQTNGVPVRILPSILHKISTLSRLNIEVERIASLIRASGAGIVFVNTLLNFPVIHAAKSANVPSIWNLREGESWDRCFRFLPDPVAQSAVSSICLPRKVIFVSQFTRKAWEALWSGGDFKVISNAVNLNRFKLSNRSAGLTHIRDNLGLEMDSIVILNTGTLCERKGQMDLVLAFAELPKEISSRIYIVMVGNFNDKYLAAINAKCRLLPDKLHGRILIFPFTESIERFYSSADIFVLSSKMESFPRVVLEAMSFGLPIITTPLPGVLEQVLEGENALFYPSGEAGLLARHIRHLVTDDDTRHRMAESSRKRFAGLIKFDEMINDYANVIRVAIG